MRRKMENMTIEQYSRAIDEFAWNLSGRISNELVAMKTEAVHVLNNIIGDEHTTMDDIYVLRGKYLFFKNCMNRIETMDRIET